LVDADYNFHYLTGLIELLSSVSANIPEMIVVGISGKGTATYRKQSKPPFKTKDKGSADVTIKFINTEVIPFIDSHYKTNSYRILAGHSIGGLFTTYAMLHHNTQFDTFIAVSPSLWWEDELVKKNTLNYFKKDKPEINTNYYLSLADEKGMGVHGFVEMMQYNAPRTLKMKFKHFPEETHGSVGLPSYRWALQDLFADYKPKGVSFTDAKAVEDYYNLMKTKYKTPFHISAGFMRNTAYAHSKDKKARLEIEQAFEKYFPNQTDEFRNIQIEGLIGAGKLIQAKEILNRALKSDQNNFETLTNQSRLLQKQKKQDKALKAIKKAIEIAQSKNIRQWLMNELVEQKEGLE
jgi:pimeloyl-ACP methyl ester carboxylesterase